MTTMGQAIDQAIKQHEKNFPGSEVYSASVKSRTPKAYRVELRASHFSCPIYYVPIA